MRDFYTNIINVTVKLHNIIVMNIYI